MRTYDRKMYCSVPGCNRIRHDMNNSKCTEHTNEYMREWKARKTHGDDLLGYKPRKGRHRGIEQTIPRPR